MKKQIKKIILTLSLVSILGLTACQANTVSKTNTSQSDNKSETIEITDIKGKQIVPVNPKKVVVLDSRSFETLASWGVKPVAAPRDLISKDNPYKNDESIQNIGNHREPKFELIAAANPDLIIIGQRFGQHYDAIKEIAPNAAIIDININLENDNPAASLVDGFKKNTEILAKIFKKEAEAKKLIDEFDKSIENAKAKVNKDDKFMGIIVTAGEIGYSAPKHGRVWGPVFDLLNLSPSLEIKDSSSNHKGDDISVEAIAQSNPDVLLVLDRDSATSTANSLPAKDVILASKTLINTKAIKNDKIFFAPNDTYVNESIETYTELFNRLAEFFNK